MRIFLTDEDRAVLEEWRRGSIQVLCDVNPRQYREPTGKVIVVPCGDGHQSGDLLRHQAEYTPAEWDRMVHPLSLNGGPLLLAPGTPILKPGETDDVVLMKHIAGSHVKKGTPTVLLVVHAPCAMAQDFSLNVIAVAELFLAAKRRVREEFPYLQIVPQFHVDWARHEREVSKKSYFFNRRGFEQWCERAA